MFAPQRWFYVGLLVSGVTLAGCLGYLGYALVRRRKGRGKSPGARGQLPETQGKILRASLLRDVKERSKRNPPKHAD